MLRKIELPVKLNVHECSCGVEFAIIGITHNGQCVWPYQNYSFCPYCGKPPNEAVEPTGSNRPKCHPKSLIVDTGNGRCCMACGGATKSHPNTQ